MRQQGSHITALLKAETTYGSIATGNWSKIPIISWDPGVNNDLVDDPSIGFGHREMLDPFRGPISIKPKLVVPVDLRNIGYYIRALLGSYSVIGSTTKTHTFKALTAGQTPSFSVEVGMPDANAGSGTYYDYVGCVIDQASFDLSPSGTPKCSLDLVAQNEQKNVSTAGGTSTQSVYTPFTQVQGTLAIDTAGTTAPGTAIGNVLGATLNIDANVDAQPGAANSGLIIGADAGQLKVSGDVTVRFDTTTIYDLAKAGGFGALSFGYSIDGNDSLNFVMPRVSWGRMSPAVNGPGGVEAKFSWQASRDSGSSASIIATLLNDVTTY